MAYEYGDAQNIAVRCFLYQFSKNFEFYEDKKYKEKVLKYFNYRCPYTGELLNQNNMVKDHIIPMNKESCGLHVFGNILYVTKEANSQKSDKTLEEYVADPERLAIIQKFVLESGYQKIKDKYTESLQKTCQNLYQEIGTTIKEKYKTFFEQYCTDIKSKKLVSPIKMINKSLDKKQIADLCYQNGFVIKGNYTKSAKNSTQDKYWTNPNFKYLEYDWTLILDDYNNHVLYCFFIPANSIKENQVKPRNDQPSLIDIQIQYDDPLFTDTRSKIAFEKWLVRKICY
jgi:hypothetical protein